MPLRPAVVEIVVADMAASLAFYRLLGLDIPAEADSEPHVDVDLGAMHIAWDTEDTIRSFHPDWTRPTGGGHSMALAFSCDTPAEVDSTWRMLTDAGHQSQLAPWDAFWGMRYAIVHDPDANPVDLFAPLPGG